MKILLFLFAINAYAQFSSQSELGLVMIKGNSVQNNLNIKTDNKFTLGNWAAKLGGAYTYGSSKKVTNAQSISLYLRLDRSLSERLSAFISTNRDRNAFAGFIYKFYTQGGFRYEFIKDDTSTLVGELSGSRLREKDLSLKAQDSYLGRVYGLYEYKFNSTASAQLWLELLPNFTNSKNYFANTELSITSMISQVLSLKVSHLYNYRNLPPLNKIKEDQKTVASIVAKF